MVRPRFGRAYQSRIRPQNGRHHQGRGGLAQYPRPHRFVQGSNQVRRVGQTAPHRHRCYPQHIDQHGQLPAHQSRPCRHNPPRHRRPFAPALHNCFRGHLHPLQRPRQPLQPARAAHGVQTPHLPAAAGQGRLLHHRPMPPFARIAPRAGNHPAVQHQPAPHAAAQNDAKHRAVPPPRARPRLGQRKAIGVVQHPHRQAQRARQIGRHRPPVQTGNIGHRRAAAVRVHNPRNRNRNRAGPGAKPRHRRHERREIAPRRGHLAQHHTAPRRPYPAAANVKRHNHRRPPVCPLLTPRPPPVKPP